MFYFNLEHIFALYLIWFFFPIRFGFRFLKIKRGKKNITVVVWLLLFSYLCARYYLSGYQQMDQIFLHINEFVLVCKSHYWLFIGFYDKILTFLTIFFGYQIHTCRETDVMVTIDNQLNFYCNKWNPNMNFAYK